MFSISRRKIQCLALSCALRKLKRAHFFVVKRNKCKTVWYSSCNLWSLWTQRNQRRIKCRAAATGSCKSVFFIRVDNKEIMEVLLLVWYAKNIYDKTYQARAVDTRTNKISYFLKRKIKWKIKKKIKKENKYTYYFYTLYTLDYTIFTQFLSNLISTNIGKSV